MSANGLKTLEERLAESRECSPKPWTHDGEPPDQLAYLDFEQLRERFPWLFSESYIQHQARLGAEKILRARARRNQQSPRFRFD